MSPPWLEAEVRAVAMGWGALLALIAQSACAWMARGIAWWLTGEITRSGASPPLEMSPRWRALGTRARGMALGRKRALTSPWAFAWMERETAWWRTRTTISSGASRPMGTSAPWLAASPPPACVWMALGTSTLQTQKSTFSCASRPLASPAFWQGMGVKARRMGWGALRPSGVPLVFTWTLRETALWRT